MSLKVFILKTYRAGEDKFGVDCVFNTIRVGLPTAELFVIDNNKNKWTHHGFIGHILTDHWLNSTDQVLFLDTDIIFYENIESKLAAIKQTLAGRYVPAYYNEVVGANECDRFHTSLLYVSDPFALHRHINNYESKPNFPFNAFAPFKFVLNGHQYFHDTCANLYHCIPENERYAFDPDLLDCYTHLVSGTMLNFVSARMEHGSRLKQLHDLAKTDPKVLRGNWREHDKYYREHSLRW